MRFSSRCLAQFLRTSQRIMTQYRRSPMSTDIAPKYSSPGQNATRGQRSALDPRLDVALRDRGGIADRDVMARGHAGMPVVQPST